MMTAATSTLVYAIHLAQYLKNQNVRNVAQRLPVRTNADVPSPLVTAQKLNALTMKQPSNTVIPGLKSLTYANHVTVTRTVATHALTFEKPAQTSQLALMMNSVISPLNQLAAVSTYAKRRTNALTLQAQKFVPPSSQHSIQLQHADHTNSSNSPMLSQVATIAVGNTSVNAKILAIWKLSNAPITVTSSTDQSNLSVAAQQRNVSASQRQPAPTALMTPHVTVPVKPKNTILTLKVARSTADVKRNQYASARAPSTHLNHQPGTRTAMNVVNHASVSKSLTLKLKRNARTSDASIPSYARITSEKKSAINLVQNVVSSTDAHQNNVQLTQNAQQSLLLRVRYSYLPAHAVLKLKRLETSLRLSPSRMAQQ